MPFANTDLTQVMGIGNYVGETRQGPDGQLYRWVEGVDGLGNTIGFWKGLKSLVSKAMPLVKFIPGIGPIIEQVRGTVKGFCRGLPQLGPVIEQAPGVKPVYEIGTKLCNILGKAGLAGAEDGMVQGPDGQLYEVIEGIGESGQVKQYLRPVWLSIPVVIRPRRRHAHRGAAAMSPGAAQPAVPVQPGARVRRFR